MDKPTRLDTLAIAAHPDDVEITCGGLLIKLAKMNRKVGVLDLTRGEMGTYGDEYDRDAESAAAEKCMGLAFRKNLELPDSGLLHNQENRLKIAAVIRETNPELVVLPHWDQRHPDHLAACRLGYDACFLAGLTKLPIEGEPCRPRKIIYASYFRNTEHSFLVDISDEFEQKITAVAAYVSQFGDSWLADNAARSPNAAESLKPVGENSIFQPGVNMYDLLHTRAHQLGQSAGCRYAEGYSIKEHILIDDPQKMPVLSI